VSYGIRTHGFPEADRAIQRVALGLSDLRSFWPLVTTAAIGWIGQQFDSEGAYFSGGWTPLSPEYSDWKDANYPGKLILSREGYLRRAATSPKRTVTPTVLILEIEPYATESGQVDPDWFQSGTENMPARPLLPADTDPLPATAQAELDQLADQYVGQLLRASGF